MKRLLIIATLLAAMPAAALELRAGLPVPLIIGSATCGSVIVAPGYSGTNPCVVAAIPANAVGLAWRATDLWEKPPALPDAEKVRLAGSVAQYNSWNRLTCGATKYGPEWSFSCFNTGLYEDANGLWQRPTDVILGVNGVHVGTAAQLDATVRGWWNAQK